MSIEQYKDANRAELWDILQIQVQVLQSEIELTTELRKQITELEEENQLLKRVEQIFSDAPDLEFSRFEEMFPDEFEVHNIEQRAKGIEDAIEWLVTHYPNACNPSAGLLTYFLGGLNKRIKEQE